KEKIAGQKRKMRREKMISDILDNMINNSKFDVPEPMINNRIVSFNEEFDRQLKENKISRNDYLSSYGITEEQFNENLRKSAVREIKQYLIFKALERLEAKNIEPAEQQIAEEKSKILNSYENEEERKKFEDLFTKPEGLAHLNAAVKQKNLFDLLLSSARIKEEKPLEGKKASSGSGKKLWTPEQNIKEAGAESESEDKKLWVPDSK
ncbi:MAG: hypothetical protein FJW61_07390, partial [Actinobacteria bacterium]|nr:hypothetical protein [Actinomycetota bacterium]